MLLPLSLPYFSVQQEINKTDATSGHAQPQKVPWGTSNSALGRTESPSLRNQFAVLLPPPKPSNTSDAEMHLPSLSSWLTQRSRNQLQPEIFMKGSRGGQKTQKFIIYRTCPLFSIQG